MNGSAAENRSVVLLSRDLVFNTKIRAVTSQRAVELKVARSVEQLREFLESSAAVLILDLHTQQPTLEEVRDLLSDLSWSGETLGYYSHVDRATAERARALGFEKAFPRSKFVAVLEQALATPALDPSTP